MVVVVVQSIAREGVSIFISTLDKVSCTVRFGASIYEKNLKTTSPLMCRISSLSHILQLLVFIPISLQSFGT